MSLFEDICPENGPQRIGFEERLDLARRSMT